MWAFEVLETLLAEIKRRAGEIIKSCIAENTLIQGVDAPVVEIHVCMLVELARLCLVGTEHPALLVDDVTWCWQTQQHLH